MADTGNNRIQEFSPNGTYITSWGGQGSENGQFNSPSGLDIDSSGNVYVPNSVNDRIQVFSQN